MKDRLEKSDVRKAWLAIVLFAAGASLIAQESTKSSGQTTFKTKCVLCHGIDGSGNTPLGKQLQTANLRSKDVQKKSNVELHKVIHDGQANMPSFADQLSDEQIDQIVKYVRALGKTAAKK